MHRLFRVLAALLIAAPAFAQDVPLVAAPWTASHAPVFVIGGGSQPVFQDSGCAGCATAGLGFSEFLQVNQPGNGVTTAPYASNGTGLLGTHTCLYDGPTTGPFHYLCLDANAQGGGLIAYGAGGGATVLPLYFNVNGVTTAVGGSSSAPTISSCGTSPAYSTGANNENGTITTGSGASTCTITWVPPRTNKPDCFLRTGATLVNPGTLSSTVMTWTASASTAYTYICEGL